MYKNQEQLVETIKSYLPDYLKMHNIIKNKNDKFQCINPNHVDINPSMSLVPSSEFKVAHCFGCNESYNIFHVCNILEGYPVDGSGFYEETIPYLCDLFNIEYEKEELNEEDLYRLKIHKIYKDAETILKKGTKDNKQFIEYISKRKWTIPLCEDMGIYMLPNDSYFYNEMEKLGYTKQDLNDAGLYFDSDKSYINKIFTKDFIIFTLYDRNKKPIGFAGRYIKHRKSSTIPKYINIKGSLGSYNIFDKGSYLYNIHNIEPNKEIYVVEGYADAISMVKYNIKNVVAVMGSNLTNKQLESLLLLHPKKIILAFDNDDAGKKATKDAIKKLKYKDVKVEILDIPTKYKDIDEFINTKGVIEFKKLNKISMFRWHLNNLTTNEPDEIINSMMPHILNEQSPLERKSMIRELALATGIDEFTINEEVEFRIKNKQSRLAKTIKNITTRKIKELNRQPLNAEEILAEAINDIRAIKSEFGEQEKFGKDLVISKLGDFLKYWEEGAGNTLNWGKFQNFIDVMNADVTDGYMALFGGNPGAGKTSLFVDMISELLKLNDDLHIIFFSIDDNYNRAMIKFIARNGNDPYNIATLQLIRDANNIPNPKLRKYALDVFNSGIETIKSYINQDRLWLFDKQDGSSYNFILTTVKKFREKYPNKKLIVFLDNFHKMTEGVGKSADDIRILYRELSQGLKDITHMYNCGMFMTVEYRKLNSDSIPTNDDMGETGKLHYDANAIFHLYNEIKAKREKAKLYHYDENPLYIEDKLVKLPTILVRPGKSKDDDATRDFYLDFFPYKCKFEPVNYETVKKRKELYHNNNIPETIINKRKEIIKRNKKLFFV